MKIISIIVLTIVVIGFGGCGVKNQYNDLATQTLEELKPIKKSKKKLGIAFGGGGVRGFTHLGVIKALEEEEIKADIVTGTSAGSIAATLYASGLTYKEIEKLVLELDEYDIADPTLFGDGGMIQGQDLANWVQNATKNKKVEDAKIKLGIAATDLNNHETVLITKGDMGRAVQTSSSIPGGFVPVRSNGKLLVDGGVLSLVPVKFNRALGADIVIGVDIYCGKLRKPKERIMNIVVASTRLQSCVISEHEMKEADYIIRPKYEPKSFRNFDSKEESIKAGYEATRKIILDLLQVLK